MSLQLGPSGSGFEFLTALSRCDADAPATAGRNRSISARFSGEAGGNDSRIIQRCASLPASLHVVVSMFVPDDIGERACCRWIMPSSHTLGETHHASTCDRVGHRIRPRSPIGRERYEQLRAVRFPGCGHLGCSGASRASPGVSSRDCLTVTRALARSAARRRLPARRRRPVDRGLQRSGRAWRASPKLNRVEQARRHDAEVVPTEISAPTVRHLRPRVRRPPVSQTVSASRRVPAAIASVHHCQSRYRDDPLARRGLSTASKWPRTWPSPAPW